MWYPEQRDFETKTGTTAVCVNSCPDEMIYTNQRVLLGEASRLAGCPANLIRKPPPLRPRESTGKCTPPFMHLQQATPKGLWGRLWGSGATHRPAHSLPRFLPQWERRGQRPAGQPHPGSAVPQLDTEKASGTARVLHLGRLHCRQRQALGWEEGSGSTGLPQNPGCSASECLALTLTGTDFVDGLRRRTISAW